MTAESTSTNKPEESQDSREEINKTLLPAKYSLMGQIISDKYIVIDAIGEGFLSVVYLGQCGETRDSVAIKTLKYENPELKKQFVEITQAFLDLKHPNIVDIMEITESEEGVPVVVMRYIEGITIKALLDNIGKIDDESTLFSIVTGICEALEYTHVKGRYHGGLSPRQILIAEDAESDGFNVTVNDFGTSLLSSQFADDGGHYLDDYLSPEQKKGEYVAVNTDIYSVAAITYELISGKKPFQKNEDDPDAEPVYTPLSVYNLELAKVDMLNQLLEQGLEQDPDWRMPNISQFKKELFEWHEIAINEYYDDSEEEEETDLSQYDEIELEDLEFDEEDDTEPTLEESQVEITEKLEERQQADVAVISASEEALEEVKAAPDSDEEADAQKENVRFQATPSFYSDLYTPKEEEKPVEIAEEKTEAVPATEEKLEAEAEPVKKRDRSAVKKTQIEPNLPEQQASAKTKETPVIEEEEVVRASQKEARKRRRRKVTRSTQSNVRATIRNLVQLRENQTNQESTMVMQFTDKFAHKGPRMSPQKTVLKLTVGAVSFVAVFSLVLLNFDYIKGTFFAGSDFLGKITAKQDNEEKEKVEVKDEKIKVIDKGFKKIKEEDIKKLKPKKGAKLESSLVTRLKLKPIEKQTPMASDYYKNWRHRKHMLKNSKVGNRRRIDYKEFNKSWLK